MNNKILFYITLFLFLPIAAMEKPQSSKSVQFLTKKDGDVIINMGHMNSRPRKESISKDMFVQTTPLTNPEKIYIGISAVAGIIHFYNIYSSFGY